MPETATEFLTLY